MASVDLDPARLERFAAALAEHPRLRIRSREIWRAFAAAFPGRPQGAEERRWLAAALDALAARGRIRLPASTRSWERLSDVALPPWVMLERPSSVARSFDWRAFPWHPRLQWIADLRQLSEEEESFLRRLNEALLAGQCAVAAPLKYRSLQLLGHEKALERLLPGRLFAPDRLSFELLGCFADVPPVAWASVGEEPSVLVVENAGAFAVARAALTSIPRPPYGIVAFGDGGRFERSVAYLATIGRPVTRIEYVGDLDAAGLRIAVGARRAAHQAGLPSVTAAAGLHRAMLDAAARLGHPGGWPAPPGRARATERLEALLAFIPRDAQADVEALLRSGHRVPEEVLGPLDLESTLAGRHVRS